MKCFTCLGEPFCGFHYPSHTSCDSVDAWVFVCSDCSENSKCVLYDKWRSRALFHKYSTLWGVESAISSFVILCIQVQWSEFDDKLLWLNSFSYVAMLSFCHASRVGAGLKIYAAVWLVAHGDVHCVLGGSPSSRYLTKYDNNKNHWTQKKVILQHFFDNPGIDILDACRIVIFPTWSG